MTIDMKEDGYFHLDSAPLLQTESWLDSCLVVYPVSYTYNGGIIVNGKYGKGFKVPPPVVPAGYKLVDIGVGLQLNHRPPTATEYLKPIM